jgi:hypothetical protein
MYLWMMGMMITIARTALMRMIKSFILMFLGKMIIVLLFYINCGFEKWLGFYIDEDTLAKLSYPNIIAHCLMEMTFFGFKQKLDEKDI